MTRPVFTLEWNDPEDAEAVAGLLQAAAIGKSGAVEDQGFMDDANSLYAQVAAHREREEGRIPKIIMVQR